MAELSLPWLSVTKGGNVRGRLSVTKGANVRGSAAGVM